MSFGLADSDCGIEGAELSFNPFYFFFVINDVFLVFRGRRSYSAPLHLNPRLSRLAYDFGLTLLALDVIRLVHQHLLPPLQLAVVKRSACLFGWWLVLICSERKVLLAGCWWLVCSERKVLLAGGR
jgi:hypothetical protein